ncbi:MAG: 3D domain-containing protein [Oscillospiraceae bacterium]|jgi:3D (Asp-Asp-Asp) domain-containing protein|nr:3D domain-containing protein [Oscillospiraceae bacterium]
MKVKYSLIALAIAAALSPVLSAAAERGAEDAPDNSANTAVELPDNPTNDTAAELSDNFRSAAAANFPITDPDSALKQRHIRELTKNTLQTRKNPPKTTPKPTQNSPKIAPVSPAPTRHLTASVQDEAIAAMLAEVPAAKILEVSATAYTTERQENKITATGTTARVGAIAVDPTVIPYGTRMYVMAADGSWVYGYATAEDCGGGIKGNKIDLFFDTYDECIQFGVKKAVVYILDDE